MESIELMAAAAVEEITNERGQILQFNVIISSCVLCVSVCVNVLFLPVLVSGFRQLPVPYTKPGVNGGTAIPLPATVMVTRRCPPDKVRPLPPTPNQQTGKSTM